MRHADAIVDDVWRSFVTYSLADNLINSGCVLATRAETRRFSASPRSTTDRPGTCRRVYCLGPI